MRILRIFAANKGAGVEGDFIITSVFAAKKGLSQGIKIFEMPLVGFLGFLPFAIEYFVVYHTMRMIIGRSIPGGRSLGYRIFD